MTRLLLALWGCSFAIGQAQDTLRGRAHHNGPLAHDVNMRPEYNALELISRCFDEIGSQLIGSGYADSATLEVRGNLDVELPLKAVDARLNSPDKVDFSLNIDGVTAPNGHYRYQVEGGLGDTFVARNQKMELTVSHEFKSYAGKVIRTRNENANLTSFQSLALKKISQMKTQILESGKYRFVYGGTGVHDGREIHVVRIFKPTRGKQAKKGPIPIQKLWTFWYDGGYELWIYADNYLPAALFYTSVDDNIFANMTIDYDREHLPKRIAIQNNSVGFDGQGELLLDYTADRVLRGLRLTFDSQKGHSIRMDLALDFLKGYDSDKFKILPPFGYKKVNRDHLKLLITTQIAGGLLQLKQHGVNIKNFKF